MAYNTTQAYGSVLNVSAGGTIASMTGLASGRYDVIVATGVEGTGTTTADNNNLALIGPAGTVSTLMASSGGLGRVTNPPFSLSMTSGGSLQVTVVGAPGGTTVIYSALIVARPIALY